MSIFETLRQAGGGDERTLSIPFKELVKAKGFHETIEKELVDKLCQEIPDNVWGLDNIDSCIDGLLTGYDDNHRTLLSSIAARFLRKIVHEDWSTEAGSADPAMQRQAAATAWFCLAKVLYSQPSSPQILGKEELLQDPAKERILLESKSMKFGDVKSPAEAEKFTTECIQALNDLISDSDQKGRWSRIYFPTVIEGTDQPCILYEMGARTFPLPKEEGTVTDQRVFIAPWSTHTISDLKDLNDIIKAEAVGTSLGFDKDHPLGMLVELIPTHIDASVSGKLVKTQTKGMSLSLAACLVLWASYKGKILRRICATGQVDKSGKVGLVEGIAGKTDVAADWLKPLTPDASPPDCLLLFPRDNEVEVIANSFKIDVGRGREFLTIASLNDVKNLPLVEQFWGLRELYKERKDSLPTLDITGLSEADIECDCDHFVESTTNDRKSPVLSVLFNQDSSPAAQRATLVLSEKLTIKRENDPEVGVPLLLSLQQVHQLGSLAKGIRESLQVLARKEKEDSLQDILPDDLLANLLGPDREKLWLVAYDAPSLTMALYDEGGAGVLKKFLDEPGKGRPNVFFVASDYHHQLFLDETFINPKPEAAETSKR